MQFGYYITLSIRYIIHTLINSNSHLKGVNHVTN